MRITETNLPSENWDEVLACWSRVVNWEHYGTTENELARQIKSLLMFLWNEKDWLKTEYPTRGQEIEDFINASDHIKVIADLANTVKHRKLTKSPRSQAKQTDYCGRITFGSGCSRQMYYVETEPHKVVELFSVIEGALNEYEGLHERLQGL